MELATIISTTTLNIKIATTSHKNDIVPPSNPWSKNNININNNQIATTLHNNKIVSAGDTCWRTQYNDSNNNRTYGDHFDPNPLDDHHQVL